MALKARAASPFVIGLMLGGLVAGAMVPWLVGDDGDASVATTAAAGASGTTVPGAPGSEPGLATGATGAGGGSAAGGAAVAGARGTRAGAAAGAPGAAAGTSGGAVAGRVASDVGITPTEVRVGVLLLNLGNVGAVGFGSGTDGLSPQEQQRWYQAYFDEANAAGGVNGRKLVPVYAEYDPVNPDTERAACLDHTEDNKVFAAMENTGGYRGPNVLCYTEEHKTPFLSSPHRHNIEITNRSGNRLMAYGMTVTRALANSVFELDAIKQLAGKRIGVIENQRPGDQKSTDVGLVATLKQMGSDVVARYAFSDELGTAASQVPIAVQAMRTARADMVYINANVLTSTQFVQAADGQNFRPRYVTVDHYGVGSDFGAMNMPASFAGSIGFTSEGDAEHNDASRPEPAVDQRCVDIVRKRTGELHGPDTNSSALIKLSCGVVDLLVNGLRNAGVNPTRASYALGVEALGRVGPPRMAPGFFAPGRFDAASQVRRQTWDGGCRCWMVTTEFHDARL